VNGHEERNEEGRMRLHSPSVIVHVGSPWTALIGVAVLVFGCVASAPIESATPSATDQAAATDLVSPSVLIAPTATVSMTMEPTGSPIAAASTEAEISSSPEPTTSPRNTPTAQPIGSERPSTCSRATDYVIAAGDTFSAIARAHGLTVDALLAANPQVANPDWIAVGDRLTISPLHLGTLGGPRSSARDINNRGQVVGWSYTASDYLAHAFLWQDGSMVDLGTLGGGGSWAMAVNDKGQVAGYSAVESGDFHAFLWQDGQMTDLGAFMGSKTTVNGMNVRGEIAGYGETNLQQRAYVWENGVMTDLGTLGGTESQAFGINDNGQVVGQSYTVTGTHAFRWQDGVMTDLGTFGWASSSAFDINNAGQVVGWVDDRTGGASRGFLSEGDTMVEVGSDRSFAYDVNERGQVVGWDWTPGQPSNDANAYSWLDGTTTDLGASAEAWSEAYAVNDCGEVAGTTGPEANDDHAIVWATVRP
jgi:probable HAF family extracellular repeat protein